MAADLRVAIVGGGLGGLVTGIALQRAGASATVLEQAADVRQIQLGGSIHLWPNGMRALAHIDLTERIKASIDDGAVITRQLFLTSSGRKLAEWSLDESVHGLSTLGVLRGPLHEVLTEAAGDILRLGTGVEGFDDDGAGVTVRLAGGGEERFDVLVGADGLHSTMRGQLLEDGPPVYSGYTSWLGISPIAPPIAEHSLRIHFGNGSRFVFWPISEGRVYWEGIHRTPAGGSDARGVREAALERYAGWVEPIEELIRATPEERVFRVDAYSRPIAPSIGAGRVTLIGDAAHPMMNALGQGANQAIEDGIVVARCLARGGDPVQALREYERLRAPRTAKYVKLSKTIARIALVRNPLAVPIRNLMVARSSGVAERNHRESVAYDAGAA